MNDFQERNPLPTNCAAMELEGKNLFEIEGGCTKDENGAFTNVICLEPGAVGSSAVPEKFTLWSHVGAAGPFTNSKGVAIDGLPMNCICESIASGVSIANIKYFNLNVFTPGQCSGRSGFSDFVYLLFGRRPAQSVPCNGFPVSTSTQSLTIIETPDLFNRIVKEGVGRVQLYLLNRLERRQLIFLALPALYRSLYSYLTRQGFTEWANVLKWPFLGTDTCAEKNATSLAYPASTFPPYVFGGITEVTYPLPPKLFGLCAYYTDTTFFCPAHQNANLQPVTSWNYNRFTPSGTFANGSTWRPYGPLECLSKCKIQAEGTAYIGDGPHGILV
jgi:hypothetical protein